MELRDSLLWTAFGLAAFSGMLGLASAVPLQSRKRFLNWAEDISSLIWLDIVRDTAVVAVPYLALVPVASSFRIGIEGTWGYYVIVAIAAVSFWGQTIVSQFPIWSTVRKMTPGVLLHHRINVG